MDKNEKAKIVSEIRKKLEKASSIYLTDFTGLTVTETNELRDEFHNAKVEYRVLKNTLLRKAIMEKSTSKFSGQADLISGQLQGPTGVVFAYDDPIIAAKIIKKFSDKLERPRLKIAVVENVAYEGKQLAVLASLPGRNEIMASIIGSIQSPIMGIVGCVNAIIRDLASVIEEVSKKKN